MHVLIVHAHPETTSFNGQLTDAAQAALQAKGHSVTVSDLYAASFDPLEAGRHYRERFNTKSFVPLAEQRHASENHTLPSDVILELEKLESADLVIFQFPLWWHGPPAILKGWFDRVFVSGKIYSSRMRYDVGYFRGKQALVSVTTGAPASAFGPGARGGDMNVMLWPIHYSLHYLGFSVLAPQCHFEASGHGYNYGNELETKRRLKTSLSLEDWVWRVAGLHNEDRLIFPSWADWDETGQPKRLSGPARF
ncbi:NAD(P)H-dependent oxidoreductase [Rhizobium etli]|uniref:NAD(P)H-dependent oxidoreductase n=1 Tax=Rhizobium etli TaxID=29449 RepID=UPI000383A37F|nr:NAD(P)H-dependent oxidoreductase [Rhizobium etli]AGS24530.1 NAD(P)H dehydrogenase (quinone) protein [Rhizobium etli bv. mimosae str. Mim1]